MKKIQSFLLAMLMVALSSCEKEPFISLSVEQINAYASEYKESIIIKTNNPWEVQESDWCTVYPASGDGGEMIVDVIVKENSAYDSRSCTLSFVSEGLTASIPVFQESKYGVVLPQDVYDVSSDAQLISVEVKANVEYDIDIDVDWIRQKDTKALTSKIYQFEIEGNDNYDKREGTITIREKQGTNVEVVKVIQAQKDAIIISSEKEYNIKGNAQTLEVEVQTNIDVDILVSEEGKTWVSYQATKALLEKTLVFDIKSNEGEDARSCEIIIKKVGGSLADTIKIKQDVYILEVHVEIPGTLESLLLGYDSKNIDAIKITGALNDEDFAYIRRCYNLKKLDISELTNTELPDYALRGCYNLSSLKLPQGLIKIGIYAISGCSSLENINIPDGVNIIEASSFNGCSSLKSITIPENVTTLEGGTFNSCGLVEVNLPERLTTIGEGCFYGCSNLEEINIPESVILIDRAAFQFCVSLKRIKLPSKLRKFGAKVFEGCVSLKNINLPDNLELIGYGAFMYCDSLETITMPDVIQTLESHVFEGCRSLTEIRLPNSLEVIGTKAFYGCESLTSIILPSKVRSICQSVFDKCGKLITVTSKATYVPFLDNWNVFDSAVSRTLIVPKGMKRAYEESDWKYYFTTIVEE